MLHTNSGDLKGTTFAGPAASAHLTAHRPSATFLAEARSALVRYLHHDHPELMRAHAAGMRAGRNTVSLVGGYNWAGYADISSISGAFTKVSGSWTTPSVTCNAEDEIASQWVGLDGATDSTVEQDGTITWCFEGSATYFTWYEMYPAGTIEVGRSLQPGDQISASVSRSGSSYALSLTDAAHPANGFTRTASCATSKCLDTSAEWIIERPSVTTTGIAPAADFGTWDLTGGAEAAAGRSGTIGSYSRVDEIECTDSTQSYAIMTPSSLTGSNSFTVTWNNSY